MQAPTETFHTMLEPTRETSGNPSGPAASADGAMPNYQRFYDKAISQLSGLISRPSCPCMCQLLHLRAVFHVLHGDVLQGLNDFVRDFDIHFGTSSHAVLRSTGPQLTHTRRAPCVT